MPVQMVEISFPVGVELDDDDVRQLIEIAGRVCDRYKAAHPGRVMWPCGVGSKPTFIPMTREQELERGIEFDDSTFAIDCYERADYDWKCAKCGLPQGDHKDCIVDPPAGECDFTVANG